MYKPVDSCVNFAKMEEAILKYWEEKGIFSKTISEREGAEDFVFYDGPPFATGLPHFGHFVPGTLKDIFPRYQTMLGKRVERRFGWDCHGLPVEYEMEKELGISGKTEIEKYGVAKFNEACRSIVLRYTEEWRQVVTRLGRWVDFDNDYKTMEPNYMESIWWVLKSLWDKGLVYKGHYILPNCPRCSTPLSNHELGLGGYKDVTDPAITVRFKQIAEDNTYFLAWTTTPWTLISNLALALGPDIDYVKVQDGGDCYILAQELLPSYYKSQEEYVVLWVKKGRELQGLEYEPLFPYFRERRSQGAFKTYLGDHVSTEDGTGIVHTASGFGEEDYTVLKDTTVEVACPVDEEGRFTAEVPDYQGRFVKDCDRDIIARLKGEGNLIKRDQILHAYPHCWRCDSPLIYKAVGSWFVDVQKIKERMLQANSKINWVPAHIRDGRFGKWLANAKDWAISRNRYWGNPLPIWECESCEKRICVGSRAELEESSGQRVEDLHKHFVDPIYFNCECGGRMSRIPEVLDCWFESGAMPYAQVHYPFENKNWFEANFPAQFICEGMDQTRGWFYTLTILGAALFDTPAFENVVVNGLVLAEDGKKMSKSLRNYSDPVEVINTFGADALRFFLVNSPAVRGEGLRYSDSGVKEVLKGVIIPLWNAYSFFVTYANIDQIKPQVPPQALENPLDQWILSETVRLVQEVRNQLDNYDAQRGTEPIVGFIDLLNNWYIRRSRRRFWKSENDGDKKQAYATLHYALMTLVKVACPFIPFVTEEIYQNLRSQTMPESIHLCTYPEGKGEERNTLLEKKMALTQQAVSMGRALRSLHNLKIRQPLGAIHLVTKDEEEQRILREMASIIAEELNVKEVFFRENEEELVEYSVKPNFKVLGKTLGKDMKLVAQRISELSSDEILSLLEGNTLSLSFEGKERNSIDLIKGSVVVQRQEKEGLKVLNEGKLTIALDPELTEELVQEGMVRDMVRTIQNLRKEKGLAVTDRIKLSLYGEERVRIALESYEDHLLQEVLGDGWEWKESPDGQKGLCGEGVPFLVSLECS